MIACATSKEEKTNLFNKYFHSVYLPAASCNFPFADNVTPVLNDIEITIHDTFIALLDLNPSKVTGIDGIGPRLLKLCPTPLCIPLQHLFSTSIKTTNIPSEWKIHKITPIFKSGDRSSICNYRPISLLCTVSKVIERLAYSKVIDFLYPSFSLSQFGFLAGRFTLQTFSIWHL